MAMDELHETAAFAGRDLDVGDFSESLEERAKLILSDVARQAANEHGGVVRVRELVHGLHGVERSTLSIEGGSSPHGARMSRDGRHHLVAALGLGLTVAAILVRAVRC
jgi:hypothetical protein